MKVINLFGGPSVGKTITGNFLSSMLATSGYSCENVSEFAKFATWAQHESSLSDQIYMFGKQHNRLHVLKPWNLDFVVMDGPLINALIYNPDSVPGPFRQTVLEAFNSYENLNFFFARNAERFPFMQKGRNESEAQAKQKDTEILDFLNKHQVPFEVVHKNSPQKMDYALTLFKRITGKDFEF